ncbi:MAG: PAS domain S-box protein [Verrucomicrobia bacterium]|nr:PAS domain S-box protein [Verrucomicrobiota bacterium]
MAAKKMMSRTMRIDLIPDVPTEPTEGGGVRRVVVSPGVPRQELLRLPTDEPEDLEDSRYYELLHSIYDAALITDMTGVITEVNARAIEFLLWPREKLIGVSVSQVISGADNDLIQTLVENLKEERFTLIQAYCVREDDSLFPAEIAVNQFREGAGNLCFFLRDIPIRRLAEEMLRTEHNAIQNAANGIAVADLAENLEYVNPAFAEMIGAESAESLVGVAVLSVVGENEMTREMMDKVLVGGETWNGELTVARSGEEDAKLEVLATCNRNSDGDTVGVVFSFTDLADRHRAEAAMRESERQRVMLESLGAACHHLGQPATVLMANLGIIRERLDTNDKLIGDLVENSLDAVTRLGEVLHKLNEVNEYRTTRYLGTDSDSKSESMILDI